MKKGLLFVVAFISVFCACTQQKPTTFSNPVIPGDFADPTVIRIGERYYASGTSSEWAPFYPVFVSEDLVNWTQTGHIFSEKPAWTSSSFWAPELFYYRNKVYAYYTARNQQGVSYIGVATAEKPTGPFTDHGVIVEYGSEAIDAFILEDNGELYISWKAYGLDPRPIELLGCKLTADGLRLDGEPFTLLRDDEGIGMEGQHWLKLGDYYYMIYSVKGCCGPKSDYQVYAARSKNLRGPYEKYEGNPILYGDGNEVISCGHGTLTTTPDGRMFYLCHAYLAGDRFYGGRQAILQEMVVDKDKWLQFTTGPVACLQQNTPFASTPQQLASAFIDGFKKSKLAPQWSWNYPYADVDVKVGDGILELSGTAHNDKGGSVLCLRPSSPSYTYETQVVNRNGSLKGLTMYGDDKNMVAFGVVDTLLILRDIREDGKGSTTLTNMMMPVESPYLRIEVTNGSVCSFFWSANGIDWEPAANMPSKDYRNLVRWDRVARPGLIHAGSPEEPAQFSYFTLQDQ